eukprot:1157808-Pelagomonas_calceolata.AAC.1
MLNSWSTHLQASNVLHRSLAHRADKDVHAHKHNKNCAPGSGAFSSPASGGQGRKCHQAPTSPPTSPPAPLLMEEKGQGFVMAGGCQGGRNGVSRGPFSAESSKFDELGI